ncbi:MAG: phosphoribosylglycinamide formyltransferase [Proteobacteria bacterium]|nr:phosphoribosylglycinamide formyltransferase [Pseudomonadota bacterium]MBU1232199.1 phosphoribosylglycinamide formyltransferase [Pseudomonadota bacterium]MBU1417114.1 phosphoribosylglycinamide formyltransferase [Pseudomonadota bacterium]MBU1453810.1 phosphoribosylglycinamide formyltransferase [Pseudomonadota bacterium]
MLKMAVLLSGSGRTLDNFHERIKDGSLHAEVQVVISNVAEALGLTKAVNYGYPAFHAAGNEEINAILEKYDIDVIVLAGFLKLYHPPSELVRSVINIHPSLIPSFCGDGFYGSRVHKALKKRGCLVSGCTVHFANEVYDEGPIIYQKSVDLDYEDSPDDIAAKVFAAECEAFPEALNRVDARGIDFFWNRVKE